MREVKEVSFRAKTTEGQLVVILREDDERIYINFFLNEFPSKRARELKDYYQKYQFKYRIDEIKTKTIKELFDKVRDITEHWNITDGITSAIFRNYVDFAESVWFTLMKFKKKSRNKLKSR